MFILYLACLIFGGALLAFSLIAGGGEHDTDSAHALGHDSDIGHDHDFLTGTDVDHSIEVTGDHSIEAAGHDTHEAGDAVKFFSFRNLIYFTAFFGLTGTVLTIFEISSLIIFLASVGMGAFSYGIGYKFMKYLKQSESGEVVNIQNIKGKNAKVVMGLSKTDKGKISVTVGDKTIKMLAKASDIAKKDTFGDGEQVLVIEIKNNTAYVVESEFS